MGAAVIGVTTLLSLVHAGMMGAMRAPITLCAVCVLSLSWSSAAGAQRVDGVRAADASLEPARSRVALPSSQSTSTTQNRAGSHSSATGARAPEDSPSSHPVPVQQPKGPSAASSGGGTPATNQRPAPGSRTDASQRSSRSSTSKAAGQRRAAGQSGARSTQGPDKPSREARILDRSKPRPTPVTAAQLEASSAEPQSREDKNSRGNRAIPLRRHGIAVHSGIVAVPHFFFSPAFASYTTAHCRGDVSRSEAADGLTRAGGCNWYVGGEYVFRRTHAFDVVTSLAYHQRKLPDGLWINRNDWRKNCTTDLGEFPCDLGMSEYAEIDMSFIQLGVDFIGRGTVVNTEKFDLQLGGGAGIYMAIFTGRGIYRTPIGRLHDTRRPGSPNDPESCKTIADLGDFARCTPRWSDDPETDQDGDGMFSDAVPDHSITRGPGLYAACAGRNCNRNDLMNFGTREKTKAPPVLPLPKIIVSVRMIFADSFALNLTGGFDLGFNFGASVQHFFDPSIVGSGSRAARRRAGGLAARR